MQPILKPCYRADSLDDYISYPVLKAIVNHSNHSSIKLANMLLMLRECSIFLKYRLEMLLKLEITKLNTKKAALSTYFKTKCRNFWSFYVQHFSIWQTKFNFYPYKWRLKGSKDNILFYGQPTFKISIRV